MSVHRGQCKEARQRRTDAHKRKLGNQVYEEIGASAAYYLSCRERMLNPEQLRLAYFQSLEQRYKEQYGELYLQYFIEAKDDYDVTNHFVSNTKVSQHADNDNSIVEDASLSYDNDKSIINDDSPSNCITIDIESTLNDSTLINDVFVSLDDLNVCDAGLPDISVIEDVISQELTPEVDEALDALYNVNNDIAARDVSNVYGTEHVSYSGNDSVYASNTDMDSISGVGNHDSGGRCFQFILRRSHLISWLQSFTMIRCSSDLFLVYSFYLLSIAITGWQCYLVYTSMARMTPVLAQVGRNVSFAFPKLIELLNPV